MSQERILVETYVKAREHYEELSEQIKRAKEALDDAEYKLTDYMTDAGIKKTAEYDDLGKINLRPTPDIVYPSVPAERQEDFFAYVRNEGEGALIRENIHYQSLCAFLKRKLSEGAALPEYVTYGLRQRATWYKPKNT